MTDKILTRVENHIGWVIYNNAEKERRLYGSWPRTPRTLLPA